MALRIGQNNQQNQMVATQKVYQGVGDFKTMVSEETKFSKEYQGEAALLSMSFTGIPGLRGPIKNTILFSNNLNPTLKAKILKIEIDQDTDPLFDKYRVRVWVAGDYQIPEQGLTGSGTKISGVGRASEYGGQIGGAIGLLPVAFLLGLVVAIGVLGIFGVIVWKMTKASWGQIVGGVIWPVILVGGALAALWVYSNSNKGSPSRA